MSTVQPGPPVEGAGMNLGIIGCGAMGAVAAEMATNAGFRVAACGDTVAKQAEALAKSYGAEATTDCMALLARADVDVVAIATPTPTHAEYAVAAARAGKHIFCEKPLARTHKQCSDILRAVEKAKVKLFVGHVVRYFQEFEAIRGQIAAGAVGDPGSVRTYRGGIFPHGEANWFRDYEQSGGVTLDCIIHDFDWLQYVFGDVERVYCQALQRSEPEVLDYAMATLRMKSGLIATVTGTWAHPAGFRVKVEVCGSGGMLTFDSDETPIAFMPRGSAGAGPGMIVPASPVPKSPYQLEWDDFAAWLAGQSEPRVTPQDGAKAVAVALAALESAATGKPVTV